ncbi:MAG: hypothetical protein ACTHU0_29495 [Kofleriaceae bacterium]
MSDPTAATGLPSAARPRYKRKLSNYLLDKKLQLRYVLVVTILSGVIAGALGFMIYQQRRAASESIERDLQVLTQQDGSQDKFQQQIASDLESDDRALVYKMIFVGLGLVSILSLYLVIMTHKVAGPLFKVSMYFDRMAEGRLGHVTPLRRGDMLQDFFTTFKDMHEAVRGRALSDADAMSAALAKLRARPDLPGALAAELDALEQHVAQRKKQLA